MTTTTSLQRVDAPETTRVGSRIKSHREARQLSVSALATNASVAQELVEQLERGDLATVTLNELDALARALEVPLLELLTSPVATKSDDELRAEREREAAAFLAALPAPLRSFVEEERAAGRTVADDALKLLAGIQFQHGSPAAPDAWRAMFQVMLQSLHPS